MKPQLFFFLSLLLVAASVTHATPLTVAVYDFTGEGEAAGYGVKTTTLVTAGLTMETNLVMLERADLNKALSEQAFGISGMVNSDAAAKIGQVTGVKVLVAGEVIKTGANHLVIVASIIGTETGRLFAAKVEGAPENLMALTTDLSRKIAQTICVQVANLVTPPTESREERVQRIVKSIKGKSRPTVSININQYNGMGQNWRDDTAEGELGAILLKAGFAVVDETADQKPEMQIIGSAATETGLPRGGLLTGRATIDLKVQERHTGNIAGFEHEDATAMDIGATAAANAAQIKAADNLAERILPLLSK